MRYSKEWRFWKSCSICGKDFYKGDYFYIFTSVHDDGYYLDYAIHKICTEEILEGNKEIRKNKREK